VRSINYALKYEATNNAEIGLASGTSNAYTLRQSPWRGIKVDYPNIRLHTDLKLLPFTLFHTIALLSIFYNMGVLDHLLWPLKTQIPQYGTGVVVAGGLASFLVLVVVLNVLKQLLFKNPNEPPIVFHWFPVIGSTITYGIDPYAFFFECRKKVRQGGLRLGECLD
jgi:hypothetical protein